MIKELIKLANHLDQKGLTKEADIVDNIIKSAGELEDMMAREMGHDPDEMPKPTLAPAEQPDMDHPVFNSGERKDGNCEELTSALLSLLGTKDDMDKFYAAAVNFTNTIKKLYNHPELDHLYVPPRSRASYDRFFTEGYRSAKYYDMDGRYTGRKKDFKEYEGELELTNNLDMLVRYISGSGIYSVGRDIKVSLVQGLGVSIPCAKSIFDKILERSKLRGIEGSKQEDSMRKHLTNEFYKEIEES